MRYIYEIWKEGSFSKAAEKLYLSQPTLSMAVKKVERSLGMPIFDRSRRPPVLTLAGKIYMETVRQAMQLEEGMERRISDIRELNAGRLCLGGSHYLNSYILPDVLTEFSRAYPKIKLELIEGSSDSLAKMLSEQELDLTFSCNEDFIADFKRYPAFRDHILLAVPQMNPVNERCGAAALTAAQVMGGHHLDPACPAVPLELFRSLEYILLTEGNNLHDRAGRLFREAGFQPNIKLEVEQLVTAYHLVEHGLGAAFVSDRLVSAATNRLRYYKLNSRQTERIFYMLLPKRTYIPDAVRAFIACFEERM